MFNRNFNIESFESKRDVVKKLHVFPISKNDSIYVVRMYYNKKNGKINIKFYGGNYENYYNYLHNDGLEEIKVAHSKLDYIAHLALQVKNPHQFIDEVVNFINVHPHYTKKKLINKIKELKIVSYKFFIGRI